MTVDRSKIFAMAFAMAAGMMVGSIYIHVTTKSNVEYLEDALRTANREAREAIREKNDYFTMLERTEARLRDAESKAATLREQLVSTRPVDAAPPSREVEDAAVNSESFWNEFQDALAQAPDAEPQAEENDADDDNNRRRRNWGDWNDPERRAEMRDRIYERIAERSDDPDLAFRFEMLSSHAEEVFDLRRQLQESTDENTRALLQEQLQQSQAAAQEFIDNEQAYSLQTLATQYGITDPEAVEAFVQDTRATMRSPIFWPMPHVTGESSFGGRRGRGGPR